MDKNKLLSIVMSTYNRCEMLQYTMPFIKRQIERNIDDVEFIVSDNGSTDETRSYLERVLEESPYFKLLKFDDHATDIGQSLTRSTEHVLGKFVLFWSDDDIPAPTMIDTLVDALHRHPDVECITFNRLQGFSDNGEFAFHQCRLMDSEFEKSEVLYEDGRSFVSERWRGMTFLPANLITLRAWIKGQEVYSEDHFGWRFLAPVLYGVSGGKCLYIKYPLCVQRWLYQPRYRIKWASYIYLGIPRVLETLQQKGVIDNWKNLYSEYLRNGQFNTSVFGYAFNMIYWASYDKEYYRPLIKDINRYQNSLVYRLLTYSILIPDFLLIPIKAFLRALLILIGKKKLV